MILQALCGYYRRARNMPGADIVEPGYAVADVYGEIVLDPEGNVVAVNPLYAADGKKKRPVPKIVPLPPKRSGSKPEGAFLYEKPEFIFGIFKNEKGAMHRFAESGRVHKEVLEGVDDEGARAVLAFFQKRRPGSTAYEGVDTSLLSETVQFFVFRLRGDSVFLHERPAVAAAWARRVASLEAGAFVRQCLVTGEQAPVARLHGNVSGFGADKPTLVGFQQDAFCSFGKFGQQGENAPVGTRAAFEYVTALNLLMRDPAHRINIAGDKVLFWAERDAPEEESLFAYAFDGAGPAREELDAPQQERVRAILEGVTAGGDPTRYKLDPSVRFFLLGLSANKTRLVIRFFHESAFGDLLGNIVRHFRDLSIAGLRNPFPSPYRLLLETAVQRKGENIAPNLDSALMNSILDGAPYPYSLCQGVLRRVRAEASVSDLRAAILKAFLIRQKEVVTMALDPCEKDAAYLLGRLFAMLEKAQRDALGDVNASVTDKYLNAALASPQMVFPTLLALGEKHISKDDNYFMKKEIGNLIGMLALQRDGESVSAFPETLDANGQGKFLVGYYHQRQVYFTPREKKPDAPEAAKE